MSATVSEASPLSLADARQLFPVFESKAYLNTATYSPGSRPARDALEVALGAWSAGELDWVDAEAAGDEARRALATLIGAHPDEVALTNAASTGAGVLSASFPRAAAGESVVFGASEFASNFLPWAALAERGYEVRLVAEREGGFRPDDFAALCDQGTRLVAVSSVQSASGYRADLPALSALARRSGAWFVVDASQSAGALPLDVGTDGVDALFACNQKFLLGARGIGYLYVKRARLGELSPVTPGWRAASEPMACFYGPSIELSKTASRLDTSLAWFSALADREGLGILHRVGAEAIHRHNQQLMEGLVAALEERGFPSPFTPAERSTIVSVPVADPEETSRRLLAAGVVAVLRAGRLRLSLHFYNDERDIERAVAEIR